jgi:hypothetical protein
MNFLFILNVFDIFKFFKGSKRDTGLTLFRTCRKQYLNYSNVSICFNYLILNKLLESFNFIRFVLVRSVEIKIYLFSAEKHLLFYFRRA